MVKKKVGTLCGTFIIQGHWNNLQKRTEELESVNRVVAHDKLPKIGKAYSL